MAAVQEWAGNYKVEKGTDRRTGLAEDEEGFQEAA